MQSSTETLPGVETGPVAAQPWMRYWRLAKGDVVRALTGWHVWVLLGLSDVRLRYKRSRFGQFWITLSMVFFVGGIGLVYGVLFHQNMHDYIPYLAVNMTVWTLIQSSVLDGCQAFIDAAPYLRQEALPKSTFLMRVLVRNMLGFLHNIVIIPIAFLFFLYPPNLTMLLAVPGLAMVLFALFEASMCLALLCTRFRDMPPIVTNLLQLCFFVTPVMWHVEQLGEHGYLIDLLNPFAAFMRIVSEPLLGRVPDSETYLAALAYLAVLSLVSWPTFAKFRGRVVYWL